MQLATSAVEPWPSGPPSALQTASGELKATPATPRPLLVFAVIVPEVCVPWPLSSAHEPLLIEPESTGRSPCDVAQSATLPVRSSCVLRMPVSTMPTFTPPVFGNAPSPARSQPAGALIFASPYSSPKRGSFGVAVIRMILLTSAYCTSEERFSDAATSAGSPDTRTTWAPSPWIVETACAPPSTEACCAAETPGANFTMTVCASYEAADAVETSANVATTASASARNLPFIGENPLPVRVPAGAPTRRPQEHSPRALARRNPRSSALRNPDRPSAPGSAAHSAA